MKFVLLAIIIIAVAFYVIKNANNKKIALENIRLGKELLEKNKQDPQILETPSGLQYQVLTKGDGDIHPSAKSTVTVHYHGTLQEGTVFDSSVARGESISFPLNRVIPGWTEGLQLMVVGDKFKFFIPSRLGYGNNGAGQIQPGSLLIFEVELLAIQ